MNKTITLMRPALAEVVLSFKSTVVGKYHQRHAVTAPVGTHEFLQRLDKSLRNPVVRDITDIQPWMFYDRLTGAAGAAQSSNLLFFTTPISASKTRLDTNLVLAGQLPPPKSFLTLAVRCVFTDMFEPDVQLMIKNYFLQFTIGDKTYGEGHFDLYPGGAGVQGAMAGTITSPAVVSTSNNGVADPRAINAWGMDNGIHIGQQEVFQVNATSPAPPTLAAAAGALGGFQPAGKGLNVRCVLDGILYRQVQ